VRHKNCNLLIRTITLQNYAILWWFLAHRCTWEYPVASLFKSLCKIENWEPAYQICYCLLSSRQQRKMWNSWCNARPHTSSLQTYDLLTVLTLFLQITGYVEYCRWNVFIQNLLKTERRWTEAASDWSVAWHPAKCRWSGDWPMASLPCCACVKAKGKHFEHMLWYAVPQLSNTLLWNLQWVIFVSQLLTRHDFSSFSSGCWTIFCTFIEFYTVKIHGH